MRFHSNKKVVLKGHESQIRHHKAIKVTGKRKQRFVQGSYKGIPVFFAARKQKNKKGVEKVVYLVTSENFGPDKTL